MLRGGVTLSETVVHGSVRLATEVSRLSRLSSDWHRVIELCAVFRTLIADEDGVYDPPS
jgi:hypothetical protein